MLQENLRMRPDKILLDFSKEDFAVSREVKGKSDDRRMRRGCKVRSRGILGACAGGFPQQGCKELL